MKKLAILFNANIYDRKGLVNAVINRAKYLKSIADYPVDVFCMQGYPAGLNSIVRKKKKIKREDYIDIDGVRVHLLWFKNYLTDDFLGHRLNTKTVLFDWFCEMGICQILKNYDFISVHGANSIVLKLKNKYGIPYAVTWHGTDIHSIPFESSYNRRMVINLLRQAEMNFFVSNDLRNQAGALAGIIPGEVSYNGVNDVFFRFSEEEHYKIRDEYGVLDKKVVAFVGNLVPVKNVMVLPEIFFSIKRKYNGGIEFWVIGDGYEREKLEVAFKRLDVNCHFWGNLSVEEMPRIYNSMDVLILPSLHEGLGMVLVEAIKCGANAVGSKVGGIPEVIGESNVFPLDDQFIKKISDRATYMLNNHVQQSISSDFSWEVSVNKENELFIKYLES